VKQLPLRELVFSVENQQVLHKESTFQVNQYMQESATLVEDTSLLDKLSMGDTIASEAKYHTRCL